LRNDQVKKTLAKAWTATPGLLERNTSIHADKSPKKDPNRHSGEGRNPSSVRSADFGLRRNDDGAIWKIAR